MLTTPKPQAALANFDFASGPELLKDILAFGAAATEAADLKPPTAQEPEDLWDGPASEAGDAGASARAGAAGAGRRSSERHSVGEAAETTVSAAGAA